MTRKLVGTNSNVIVALSEKLLAETAHKHGYGVKFRVDDDGEDGEIE